MSHKSTVEAAINSYWNNQLQTVGGSHVVFCLDTLHRCSDTLHGCSNTLHGYSGGMLVDFSVFSSIPRKLYTIFQPTFSPIKRYQDILSKHLTLSTDSDTKRITVIHAVYFYNSGSIFATNIL